MWVYSIEPTKMADLGFVDQLPKEIPLRPVANPETKKEDLCRVKTNSIPPTFEKNV